MSSGDKVRLCILPVDDKVADWSAFCVTGLDVSRITAWILSWILSSSDKVHASVLPVGGNIADWSAFCVTGLGKALWGIKLVFAFCQSTTKLLIGAPAALEVWWV